MMKILFFITLLVFVSCKESKEPLNLMTGAKPKLSSKQIAKILCQFHLLESSRNILNLQDSNKTPALNLALQNNILQNAMVSQQEYNTAFNYYMQNADTLNYIYDLVILELSILQAKAIK